MKPSPPPIKPANNDTVIITIETCDSKTCVTCGNYECPSETSQKQKSPKSAPVIGEPTKNRTMREPSKQREPSEKQPQRDPSRVREPTKQESRPVDAVREPIKEESRPIKTLPIEPSSQKLVLPILPNRIHGPGCVMEINVLEKHDKACAFKKAENEFRNDLDDRAGSYDCVGRLVFRTCDKKTTQPAPLVLQDYDGSRHVVSKDKAASRSRITVGSSEMRNSSQLEPVKNASSRNATRDPSIRSSRRINENRSRTSQKEENDVQELPGSRIIQKSRILPKKKESQFNAAWEENPNKFPDTSVSGGILIEEVSRPSSPSFTFNDGNRSTTRSGSRSRTNGGSQSNRAISFNSRVASKSKSHNSYEEAEDFGEPKFHSSGIENSTFNIANDSTLNSTNFRSDNSMINPSDLQTGNRTSSRSVRDPTNAFSTNQSGMQLMSGSSFSASMYNPDDLDKNFEDDPEAEETYAVMTLLSQPNHRSALRGDSKNPPGSVAKTKLNGPLSNLIFNKAKMQALEDAISRQKELNTIATSTKKFPVWSPTNPKFFQSEDTIISLTEPLSGSLKANSEDVSRAPIKFVSGVTVNMSQKSNGSDVSRRSKFVGFFKRKQKSRDNNGDEKGASSRGKEEHGSIEEPSRLRWANRF